MNDEQSNMGETEITDNYNVVRNQPEGARAIGDTLRSMGSVSITLTAGPGTMFHITFVDLSQSVPPDVHFNDGSREGLHISIHDRGSYSLPWGNPVHAPYLSRKLNIPLVDAKALTDFINTVITGKNYFNDDWQ